MHSYTLSNRDLRFKYLKNPKEKGPYPENINLRNFTYFLWAPTLCYEPSYPIVKKIRISYLIRKLY